MKICGRQCGIGDFLVMSGSRQRQNLKRPTWIIILVSVVSIFLISAYVYPPRSLSDCYFFKSKGRTAFQNPQLLPSKELTDDEAAARVVIDEILRTPPIHSKNPKVAFMFLAAGSLSFERLWDKFLHGHEDRFSIYIHASREKPVHVSDYFVDREIRGEKVEWGQFSMIDAEKRLLAEALMDLDNQQFVLLSDSCVPLYNFDYIYNYLMFTNVSYIDSFEDPGPHGNGRYSDYMLPEVQKGDFRKGAQWFSMKRQHAIIVMEDNLYYTKFKLYCKMFLRVPMFQPKMDGRNCYSDEHYFPTFLHMVDRGGIANWSLTHVDWSEGKWHPKAYRTQDVTYELLNNINSIDEVVHVTSDAEKKVTVRPCLWNGMKRPCYLFARKFYPETLDKLMFLFSNYTTV